LGEELLEPTRIYVKSILSLCKEVYPLGMAHITGGGFIENIPRMLPSGLGVHIQKGSWTIPTIFSFLQEKGQIHESEIYNIFNMGIGMVIVVKEKDVEKSIEILKESGEIPSIIGHVQAGEGVTFS